VSISVRTSTSGSPLSRFEWSVLAARWADEVGPLVRTAIKEKAPEGKGPGAGRLKRSIRYQRHLLGGGSRVSLEFTANTPYAGFVLRGTPPHEIRPNAARMLHWTESDGHGRFARVVHHPGTRANKFPERAIVPMLPLIQERFRIAVTEQLRG
jgi:hypothetical protein